MVLTVVDVGGGRNEKRRWMRVGDGRVRVVMDDATVVDMVVVGDGRVVMEMETDGLDVLGCSAGECLDEMALAV